MRKWLIPVLSLAALTACGETTKQRATTGAVGGGAAGAVVGGPVGAVAGAGIGAVAGANRDKVDSGTDKATDAAREKVAEATTDRSGQQAATARSADRVSGPGPTNEEVKEAQIVLQEMGLYDGKVDGIYGRKTVAAVGKFQEQNDLPRTRTLNEPTQQKLQQQASAAGKNRDQGSSQDSQTPPAQPKAQEGTSPAPQQTQ